MMKVEQTAPDECPMLSTVINSTSVVEGIEDNSSVQALMLDLLLPETDKKLRHPRGSMTEPSLCLDTTS